MMGELTPPGFEYMVGVAPWASFWSPASSAYEKQTIVFRLIWTLESLRGNYWTECDTGSSRQERKQLEGLPCPIRTQRSGVPRRVVWRQRAEREARSTAVGRGAARGE
jgi:hypothetical protein